MLSSKLPFGATHALSRWELWETVQSMCLSPLPAQVHWLGSISHLPAVIGRRLLPCLIHFLALGPSCVQGELTLAARESQVKGIWKSGWCVTVKVHCPQEINTSFQLPSMLPLSIWLCPLVASFSASYFQLVCLFWFPTINSRIRLSSDSPKRETGWWVSHCLSMGQSPPFRTSGRHTGHRLAALWSGGLAWANRLWPGRRVRLRSSAV